MTSISECVELWQSSCNLLTSGQLHDASRRDPQLLGRVFQGQKGTTIEVTVEALKLRFLKVLVVATLLLICGRNIY